MHYFDPARPRLLNNLPAWLSAPNIALPRLILEPSLSHLPRICAMINGSWKQAGPLDMSLDKVFQLWLLDPEQFAKDYFGVEIIRAEGAPQLTESLPSIDPADLGI